MLVFLIPLLLFVGQASSQAVNITSVSYETLPSCFLFQSIQLLLIGEGFVSGEKCVLSNAFQRTEGNAAPSGDDILCIFETGFEPGEYSISYTLGAEEFFYPNPITIVPDVAVQSSLVFESPDFLAGENITFQVIGLTECGTVAECGTSDLAFNISSSTSLDILSKIVSDGGCYFVLEPLYETGVYSLITIENGTAQSSSINIMTDISLIDQPNSRIVNPSFTAKIGEEGCLEASLVDIYGNLIDQLSENDFDVVWTSGSPFVLGKNINVMMNGHYEICFVPYEYSHTSLSISAGSYSLTNSPYTMSLNQGDFVPENSLIRNREICPSDCASNGDLEFVAGVEFSFTIVPKDAFENQLTSVSAINLNSFQGYVTATTGELSHPFTFQKNGEYVVASRTVTQAGIYSVNMTYEGVLVEYGNFPTVTIAPNSMDPSAAVWDAAPVSLAAGVPLLLPVTAYDSYANLVPAHLSSWAAHADGPDPIDCAVTELGDGDYQASCVFQRTGTYTFQFFLDSSPIPGTKTITVTPAKISASNSYFTDFTHTIESNTTGVIFVHTYDIYSNKGGTRAPLEKFQVVAQISSGNRIIERFSTETLTPTGDPTILEASFTLKTSGNYSLAVMFVGSPLWTPDSPFIYVTPGVTVGSKCTLDLATSVPVADQPVFLTLYARDFFGNIQDVDEISDFGVTAINALDRTFTVSCTVSPSSRVGVYNVSCPMTLVGPYDLFGAYKGVDAFLVSTPVEVIAGPISQSTTSFERNSLGQTNAEAGARTLIYIQGRDASYNPLTFPEDYHVFLTHGSKKRAPLVINATKVDDETLGYQGVSVYEYNTTVSGVYKVHVQKDGVEIAGSPSTLVVSSATPVASTAEYNLEENVPYVVNVDEKVVITFTIYDNFGNHVDGQDSVFGSLLATGSTGFFSSEAVFSSGSYTFTFTPNVGGQYGLNLLVNGETIPNNIVVQVLSLVGGSCTDFENSLNQGQKWELVCTAFDQYGFEKREGGDLITFDAPRGSVSVIDLEDGRYKVIYSSQVIGRRTLTIFINEKEVLNMPYRPVIIPGALVLGTVIPAIFIAAVLVAVAVYIYLQRKAKQEQLMKKKRKPQQVFKPEDEGEWSDDYGDEEQENWFAPSAGKENQEKMKEAHNMVMMEMED